MNNITPSDMLAASTEPITRDLLQPPYHMPTTTTTLPQTLNPVQIENLRFTILYSDYSLSVREKALDALLNNAQSEALLTALQQLLEQEST